MSSQMTKNIVFLANKPMVAHSLPRSTDDVATFLFGILVVHDSLLQDGPMSHRGPQHLKSAFDFYCFEFKSTKYCKQMHKYTIKTVV